MLRQIEAQMLKSLQMLCPFCEIKTAHNKCLKCGYNSNIELTEQDASKLGTNENGLWLVRDDKGRAKIEEQKTEKKKGIENKVYPDETIICKNEPNQDNLNNLSTIPGEGQNVT